MDTMNRTPLARLHESVSTVWMPLHGWEIPAHYGSPQDEYAALQESAVMTDISHWAKLSVTGPERKTFIHGMITNEVNRLLPGEGNYSLFLTAKGKIVADCYVSDFDESLFLYGREANRKPLFEGLNKYLIMEDAEIHDQTEQHALFSVQGKQAETILKQMDDTTLLPEKTYHFTQTSLQSVSCTIYKSSHTLFSGYDILLALEDADAVWKLLYETGCKPAGWDALEQARIEAGIPVLHKELDDTVIPQEAGLVSAISFDKGCYIGQETVARLHFRGHVNRELTGFVLDTQSVPETTLLLQHEGKDVGKITSVVRSDTLGKTIGLGYLRSALRKPGTKLKSTVDGQEIAVSVHELPFVSL